MSLLGTLGLQHIELLLPPLSWKKKKKMSDSYDIVSLCLTNTLFQKTCFSFLNGGKIHWEII